jgi:hypothetical protein
MAVPCRAKWGSRLAVLLLIPRRRLCGTVAPKSETENQGNSGFKLQRDSTDGTAFSAWADNGLIYILLPGQRKLA